MLKGALRTGRPGWLGVAAALILCACNGSRDRLLANLQSPRPEERAHAVRKLAEQNKPEDLVLFTQAAKDPAAIVREEAIAALGRSQDARVVDLLGELLGDPDDAVQAKAAMALADIRTDKARGYLTLQYGRRGRATRQAIVQALKAANIPGPMAGVVAAEAKTIWERNLLALNDGTLAERVGAAEELGKSGRAEAVNRLVPLVKDSQVVLAAAAVRGLGYAGDRRAVASISELLSENFPDLREAACESLLKLQDPAALPKLAEVAVERSPASPLATAAVIALPKSPETDQALCDIALNGALAEATAAGREMRRRGGCPQEPLLERLRQPSQAASALQAVIGLGEVARDSLPRVLPLLSSADPNVRRLAVDALAEIGDREAAPAVVKAYEQELKVIQQLRADWIPGALPNEYAPGFDPAEAEASDSKRARQAELFQKVEQRDAARAAELDRVLLEPRRPTELIDDTSEEQLRLLAALVRALGMLGAEQALETLRLHADDGSPLLRAAAYAGLAHLGPEGLAVARKGLVETSREVQAATAHALAERGPEGQAAILELLPRLGDRGRLLEALSRAGPGEAAIEPLQALLKEGGAEAGVAAELLGQLKARRAVDALVRQLDDPTSVARRDVLLALGKIGDLRAVEAITRDLFHDTPDVRAAAAEALATLLATPEARSSLRAGPHVDALDALKSDYYRKVREAAQAALAAISSGSEPAR